MVNCVPLIQNPEICSLLVNTIFPWIFSFAIVYGLILRSKVFGEATESAARGISGLIAIVAAFLIVMVGSPYFSAFLTSVSGTVVMYAAVILGIVMLFAIINPDLLRNFNGGEGLALIIGIILVAGLIVSGFTPGIGTLQITQDVVALVIVLLIIAGIIWFVVKGGEAQPQGTNE